MDFLRSAWALCNVDALPKHTPYDGGEENPYVFTNNAKGTEGQAQVTLNYIAEEWSILRQTHDGHSNEVGEPNAGGQVMSQSYQRVLKELEDMKLPKLLKKLPM